jgi:hypothetical protein
VLGDIFDGLRDFYSRKEGPSTGPAFSAAMLLSFMFMVNLFSITSILDLLLHGHVMVVSWLLRYKAIVVLIGIVIAWGHVLLAKRSGLYYKTGPVRSATWHRSFIGCCVLTGLLFFASLTTAYIFEKH